MSQFPRATSRSGRRRPVRPGASQTRVKRHEFVPDDSIPPDHRQHETCRSCQTLGVPGDARHFGPDDAAEQYPVQDPEARQLELRRLGERDD